MVEPSTHGPAWLGWSRDTFARAAAERRPVLLGLGATWCRWSAEMRRTTYADPRVCDLIRQGFIPVWVDADRRPDINERYNLGGWPTTAFLSSDGHLLGGETYVTSERMVGLLPRVADAYADHLDRETRSSEVARPDSAASARHASISEQQFIDSLEHHVLEQFDPVHGGFGVGEKQVHEGTVRFALKQASDGHAALREVAQRTLDAMAWGGLYDDVDGGVFRFCEARDWTHPHVEKLADVNAAVLGLLIEGWLVFREERYRDRAVHLIGYLRRALLDPDEGGCYASQFADSEYYAADPDERTQRPIPAIDRSVYADHTARVAIALLHASEPLGDTSLAERAVTALERVVGDTYQRGGGIAHISEDADVSRGWLRDQVWASDALIDAYVASDRDVYLDLAQELMRHAMGALWDPEHAAFRDRVSRADDVGLLCEPLRPFVLNAHAARVLARLAHATADEGFARRAADIVDRLLPDALRHGIDAAPLALAVFALRG